MAKQTLFEAEAILTANTAGMLRDIDNAVAQAKAKLASLSGSVSLFGNVGGSWGGGSSGGSRNRINPFGDELQLAQMERGLGRFSEAIKRYQSLLANTGLSGGQVIRVQKELAMTMKQQSDISTKAFEKEIASWEKAAAASSNTTNRATRDSQAFANAQVRAAAASGDFSRAIAIQQRHMATLEYGSTGWYNNMTKLQELHNANNAGGGSAARRRNAMVQNLSFGAQDFITVLSMGGGMGRALASASNNLAFMTSMMGTTGGAVAGFAVTLGAVMLPAVYKAVMGFEDMAIGAKRLQNALRDLNDEMARVKTNAQVYNEAKDLANEAFRTGNRGGIFSARSGTQRDLDTAALVYKAASDSASDVRATAVRNFFKQMGKTGTAWQKSEQGKAWAQQITAGTFTAEQVRGQANDTNFLEDWMFGTGDAFKTLAEAIDAANEPSKNAAKTIEELNQKLRNLDLALDKTGNDKFMNFARAGMGLLNSGVNAINEMFTEGSPLDLSDPSNKLFGDLKSKYSKGKQQQENMLQLKQQGIRGVLSAIYPKEAEKQEVRRQYEAAMNAVDDPAQKKKLEAMRDFQLQQIDKKSLGGISGTMGSNAFANQLTNQLLKSDPSKELQKVAEQQKDLLDTLVNKDNAITKAIKDINVTPFTKE